MQVPPRRRRPRARGRTRRPAAAGNAPPRRRGRGLPEAARSAWRRRPADRCAEVAGADHAQARPVGVVVAGIEGLDVLLVADEVDAAHRGRGGVEAAADETAHRQPAREQGRQADEENDDGDEARIVCGRLGEEADDQHHRPGDEPQGDHATQAGAPSTRRSRAYSPRRAFVVTITRLRSAVSCRPRVSVGPASSFESRRSGRRVRSSPASRPRWRRSAMAAATESMSRMTPRPRCGTAAPPRRGGGASPFPA